VEMNWGGKEEGDLFSRGGEPLGNPNLEEIRNRDYTGGGGVGKQEYSFL